MIKITRADYWFSKCVRERAGWRCEYCGKQYDRNSAGLHCSHFFGRRHKSTRHDPNNAFSHCYGCHQFLGSNPHYFTGWVKEILGGGAYDALSERHKQIMKITRNWVKPIAQHYRIEYQKMLEQRNKGENGRIEFHAYW